MVDADQSTTDAFLPSELILHVASFLDLTTLARAERVSKQWRSLLRSADVRLWAHHASSRATTIKRFVHDRQENCIDRTFWQGVNTWKEVARRGKALEYNWGKAASPLVETNIVGYRSVNPQHASSSTSGLTTTSTRQPPAPVLRSLHTGRPLNLALASADSSHVWRARLDTAQDAQFIVATFMSGGLRVIDARLGGNGAILWELPKWSVRPFAHLEYGKGIACWDSARGIEVWKRWKLTQVEETDREQNEPASKRGTFVHVATIPDLPGMRGFMINEALHLTIVSQAGRTWTYDVGRRCEDEGGNLPVGRVPAEVYNFPIKTGGSWVYDFSIKRGATGHLEHNEDYVVFSMGHDGYSVYHKQSAKHMGDMKFNEGPLFSAMEQCASTNMLRIDPGRNLPVTNTDATFQLAHVKTLAEEDLPMTTETGTARRTTTTAGTAEGGVEDVMPRARKPSLQEDVWGATMIRRLDDGATLLAARSKAGRFMICSDLLGLLACIEEGSQEMIDTKVRQCLAIVACGGTLCISEFEAGGWLAVHGGRAAWEIEGRLYLFDLPVKKNTVPNLNTRVMTLNGHYTGEITIPRVQAPVSILSLHDDCLLSTYLHPAYTLQNGWEASLLKSVRLIRFAPRALEAVETACNPVHGDESGTADGGAGSSLPLRLSDLNLHRQWQVFSVRANPAPPVDEQGDWDDTDDDWDDTNDDDDNDEEERA